VSLRPYQRQIVGHICTNKRTNLFVPMGGGKTMAVLTALDLLDLAEDVFPALVVAPLRVAVSTWPAEITKWAHLRRLRVSVITGSPAERGAALRRPADIYCINYDNLQWLAEAASPNDRYAYRTVVADECTRLKGFRTRQGSKRAAALARIAATADRYIGLTGTPASNGLKDLWGVQWFTDRGERLGRSYSAYMSRWFKDTAPYANYPVWEPMDHAEREIHEKIADITISIDLKDYLDLKEPVVNTIEVDIPASARRAYDDMWKEMVAELRKGEITAVNAAVKTSKCLQIASGAVYTDDHGTWEEVHRAKIDALESIIEEAGGAPVLVAYHFKSDLARLLKAFPQGRELDKNPKTIEAWNRGKIPLLFAHPASAGHGLNLQDGGNILAFFSLNWNLEEHLQIIERIGPARQAQAGHDRPVFIHYILARDTLDAAVLERLQGKKTVVEAIMEAMKK
jgi:SNF2 family DNA or RNA helicase